MASRAEALSSLSLRSILADLPIGGSFTDSETKEVRDFLFWLEPFVTQVLAEVHPEWRNEKGWDDVMDGIEPLIARKTAEDATELFAGCYLLTNQARRTEVVPLHVRLQLVPAADEFTWLECRLGERGQNGMLRLPYDGINLLPKRFYLLDGDYDRIDWFYAVTFGEPRSA